MQSTCTLFEVTLKLWWNVFFIHFEQFYENVIRCWNHYIFPTSTVNNAFFEYNSMGFHVVNDTFDIICLDSKMMDAPSAGKFWTLIVKMESPPANFHKHIAGTSKLSVQNSFSAKKLFIKFDALIEVGCKDVNVMKVVHMCLPIYKPLVVLWMYNLQWLCFFPSA